MHAGPTRGNHFDIHEIRVHTSDAELDGYVRACYARFAIRIGCIQ
jgi:hypothetical protein